VATLERHAMCYQPAVLAAEVYKTPFLQPHASLFTPVPASLPLPIARRHAMRYQPAMLSGTAYCRILHISSEQHPKPFSCHRHAMCFSCPCCLSSCRTLPSLPSTADCVQACHALPACSAGGGGVPPPPQRPGHHCPRVCGVLQPAGHRQAALPGGRHAAGAALAGGQQHAAV
jgi:hypothetical protein